MSREVEKTFFLTCLKNFLNGEKTELPAEEIDWDEMFCIAEVQNLEALLYYQCNAIMPENCKKKHLRNYLSHAVMDIRRQEAFKEVIINAQKNALPIICMKGTVCRGVYPIPGLRSMGDMDLILREEDRMVLDQILQNELGYQRFIDNHAVWTYWKNNVYLEIHSHMFYEELTNTVDYRMYFDQVWVHKRNEVVYGIQSANLYVPDAAFHLLYLITHTAKHITNNGSGFRPYLDMVLFARKYKDQLDWTYIHQELEKLQLIEFARVCFELCRRWFAVEMPLEKAEISDAFLVSATEKTFADGIFGLENQANEAANTAKQIKRSRLPYAVTALQITIRKLFPAYEDMQLVPWYSFVDGRPWLMPYAWVYRWFYCIRNKRGAGTDLLTEPFLKGSVIAARKDWLKQWGL